MQGRCILILIINRISVKVAQIDLMHHAMVPIMNSFNRTFSQTQPRNIKRLKLALSLALATASLAPLALADDAAGALGAEEASDEQVKRLDEIIVTGTKSKRTIQEITASVAVTTSRDIEREGLNSLSDVFQRTANVTDVFGGAQFSIRGIRNRQPGGDAPLSTVYFDGAALPNDMLIASPTNLWDVGQVEVLRGPQSTIQGENALAGAVVIRSDDPSFYPEGRLRVQYADPEAWSWAVAGGGGLIEDELAVRITAERRFERGIIKNPTRDNYADNESTFFGRIKFLWQPSWLPNATMRFTYMHADRKDGPYNAPYAQTDVPDAFNNRVITSNRETLTRGPSDLANFEFDYDFDGAWRVTAVTAWNKADIKRAYDFDYSPVDLAYGTRYAKPETLSQEFRFLYEGEHLNGLFGVYWADRDNEASGTNRTTVPTPARTIAGLLMQQGVPQAQAVAIATQYAQAMPFILVDYNSDSPNGSTNFAFFADGEYQLTDKLSVIAGFRQDKQSYTFSDTSTAVFAGQYPDPANYGVPGTPLYNAIFGINRGVAQLVAQADGVTPRNTRDFNAFLPKLGVKYDISPTMTASFVVQRGYRSGGSNSNIARNKVFDYDPEFTWNYEAGLRSNWLDNRLNLNMNVFYVDWKDKQVNANFGQSTFDSHTVNAASAHLYGFEVESVYRVNEFWDWYASLGYTKTRFDDFVAIAGATIENRTGQAFSYAPDWTFGGGANFNFADGWNANVNLTYRGEMLSYGTQMLSARTLVNAKVGYEATNWAAYLTGHNLFNEEYMDYFWEPRKLARFGTPRTLGLELEYRW